MSWLQKTVAVGLILSASLASAAEKDYQQFWCSEQGGKAEVTLSDRTRADCLTEKHAIEVEFARKWPEAVGQSLHYARLTGKKPGVLLILQTDKDQRHLQNLAAIAGPLNIDIWVIKWQ